jgi:hypothetical protein
MPHIVDELLDEAAQAVRAMRHAALRARKLHARAELMRHMRLTARKVMDRPVEEAINFVSAEWMKAWGFNSDGYGDVAIHVRGFTESFCNDAHAPSEATSAAILTALTRLEGALERAGTSLSDQMAFRSECAHGWWEMVVPPPADNRERPKVPRWTPGRVFWEVGAAPECMVG